MITAALEIRKAGILVKEAKKSDDIVKDPNFFPYFNCKFNHRKHGKHGINEIGAILPCFLCLQWLWCKCKYYRNCLLGAHSTALIIKVRFFFNSDPILKVDNCVL